MEFYHVLNRGVDKRNVVNDDSDRLRFIHSLFILNDRNPLNENHRFKGQMQSASSRDLLVHIHAWCLMDNHYHILLSPVRDEKDISVYMKRLNMGYARYYNDRHNRSGYLWQGKYKKIHLENDSHFNYIPYYIHLNPLDYSFPKWRKGEVADSKKAIEFLNTYRWSSYLDYTGVKNFPSVIEPGFLNKVLDVKKEQLIEIENIISSPSRAQKSSIIEID